MLKIIFFLFFNSIDKFYQALKFCKQSFLSLTKNSMICFQLFLFPAGMPLCSICAFHCPPYVIKPLHLISLFYINIIHCMIIMLVSTNLIMMSNFFFFFFFIRCGNFVQFYTLQSRQLLYLFFQTRVTHPSTDPNSFLRNLFWTYLKNSIFNSWR